MQVVGFYVKGQQAYSAQEWLAGRVNVPMLAVAALPLAPGPYMFDILRWGVRFFTRKKLLKWLVSLGLMKTPSFFEFADLLGRAISFEPGMLMKLNNLWVTTFGHDEIMKVAQMVGHYTNYANWGEYVNTIMNTLKHLWGWWW